MKRIPMRSTRQFSYLRAIPQAVRWTSATRMRLRGSPASLLEEELALLRGVNDSNVHEPPVFNRLRWNLTGDNLIQPLYVLNYGITEDNIGTLSEDSPEVRAELRKITDIAKKRYPQGHGDAYGHYLSALKVFYDLVRDEEFDWTVGSSITGHRVGRRRGGLLR